jgi:hypothetical protein
VVLADSPLNALSFWCADVKHVACTLHGQEIGEVPERMGERMGAKGWVSPFFVMWTTTPRHRTALPAKRHGLSH